MQPSPKNDTLKARVGLIAVAAILLGCLGILMLPQAAQGNNPAPVEPEAQPAAHTTPAATPHTEISSNTNPKL